MMNQPPSLLWLALLLLASGCVRSEQPLSDAKDARADLRLAGQWRARDKPQTGVRIDEATPKDRLLKVSFDEHGVGHAEFLEEGVAKPGNIQFFVTRTSRQAFLNVQEPGLSPPLYHLFKYQVSDGGRSVQLWSLRTAFFEAAIKENRLKGKISVDPPGDDPGSGGTYTLLQDASDKVLRVIELKPEQEMFTDLLSLEKVQ